MERYFKIGLLSSLILGGIMQTSCSSEAIDTDSIVIIEHDTNGNYIFNASLNEYETTRTIRQDNGSVYWDKNESITIFYDSQTYGVFTSTNKTTGATASFSGKFNAPVSDNDISENGILALYPSQEAEYIDDNVIFTLPSLQEAEVGTFKNGLFPSVAKSNSSSLSFYNVCGGIKLSVHYEGIKSITLRGNNSETLAGRISVSFSASGIPEYSIVDGVSEITLTAPQGGCFEVGKMYYIVALPCTMLNGFTIIYHTDNDDATVKINNTVTIHRSKFGLVLEKDVHGFVVKFADPYFKASVVDQYDDNFDGEIDYIEAESVTNINCSNMGVTSLKGIEHFANLKTLNCSSNYIKEIDLKQKSKLTTLYCYDNPIEILNVDECTSLTALSIINANTQSISSKHVNIDGYNSAEKFVFSANDAGFTDFSFVNSNTVKTLEISGDFTKLLNVYNIPNVTELIVGHMNVEVMDLHNLNLSSVDLTNNTNLKELYIQNNKLTSINLSKNTLLTKLNVSDNKLSSINIRNNTLLTELKCNNNSSVTNLNLDSNLSLKTLEAEGLSISAIDLSQHKSLTDVRLRNNPRLSSMVIWEAATKTNDYLMFDMANVMVTDANGNSYGYPYTVGQVIPWFNGGVVYSVNDKGGGMMVYHKNTTQIRYGKYYNASYGVRNGFYWRPKDSDPWIPEMFWGNSETDGEQNMKVVYDYYSGYDKFTAFGTCSELSNDGKWYIPSIEEMEELIIQYHTDSVLYRYLYLSGNGRIEDSYYTTSTINDDGEIAITKWQTNSKDLQRYYVYSGGNYLISSGYLRAIRKF